MREGRLDMLRGLAALSVAIGHTVATISGDGEFSRIAMADVPSLEIGIYRALHAVFNANAAVVLFFVLSGHVLTQSLLARELNWRQFPAYLVRRVLRLGPVLLLALGFMALLIPVSWEVFVANLLLLVPSMNYSTWTLQIELVWSLLLFGVPLLGRPHPGLRWLLVGALFAVGLLSFDNQLLAYGPVLLAGSLVGDLRRWFTPRPGLFWLGLAVFLFTSSVLGRHTMLPIYIEALGALLMVHSAPALRSCGPLDGRLGQFLGDISYPFYLLHQPVAVLVTVWLALAGLPLEAQHPAIGMLLYGGFSIVLAAGLALIVHRVVELPGMALGSRLAKRLNGASPLRRAAAAA